MMFASMISIIIPVFNVEQYLPKCLDSVINQTCKNIEIILVDDGSKDSSGRICDKYAQQDSRIIVVHKENGGLSSARNAGLDIATGDYVMFVDSDDYVEPYFCEIPLKYAIENNVEIVSFGYYRVYEDGRRIEFKTSNPRIISSSEGILQLIKKTDVIHNLPCNKFFKRTLFREIRFPLGKEYEDQATTYLLFHRASGIYVSDCILYNYLYRETSISAVWNKPKSIIARFSIWLDRLTFIEKNYPELQSAQIDQLVNEAINGYIRLSGQNQYKDSIKMFSVFMDRYKMIILSMRKATFIKLYYLNKSLFFIYCKFLRFRYFKTVH